MKKRNASWTLTLLCFALGCSSKAPAKSPLEGEGASAEREGSTSAPRTVRECNKSDPFSPVVVSGAEYRSRWGAGATKFAEVRSTKARPMEECGLTAVVEKLATLTCNDGSNPFDGDLERAHRSRSGNVGGGGLCDQIIDLYSVRCPEVTYEIYADMYLCEEGNHPNFPM